jgi:hypothetical protein
MKGSSLVGCWLGSWLHVAAGIIIVASLRERKQFPHGAEKRKTFRSVRKSGKLSAACGKAENFPQAESFPAQGWEFSALFLAIEELGELASAKKLIMNNR